MSHEMILQKIENAKNIYEVDAILTESIANLSIQSILKDNKLTRIIESIVNIASVNKDPKSIVRLTSVASLARLGAISKNRINEIKKAIQEIIKDYPCDIEQLKSGELKNYACNGIYLLNNHWVLDYCLEQSLKIDINEKARKILIFKILEINSNLSDAFEKSKNAFFYLDSISNIDVRTRRAKRICEAWKENILVWAGEIGRDFGVNLNLWFTYLLSSFKTNQEDVALSIAEDIFSIITRALELRFSYALKSETYCVVESLRNKISSEKYSEFSKFSPNADRLKITLNEVALVLATQNKTDKKIMTIMSKIHYSRSQVISTLKSHFNNSAELEPNIKKWWLSGGKDEVLNFQKDQEFGGSEDKLISQIFLTSNDMSLNLKKIDSKVESILNAIDKTLEFNFTQLTHGINNLNQSIYNLSKLRKVSINEEKGLVVDYNPLIHEMIDGHQYGIRRVKIIRNGVLKNYAGKIKYILKPLVEKIDE